MLLIALCHAGGTYTIDDVVAASARGLSPEALATIAERGAPWSISHADVVVLLRSGVSPDVVRIMTNGHEPTDGTLAEAKQPGASYQPKVAPPTPPPAKTGLTRSSGGAPLDCVLVEEVDGTGDALYSRARRWFSAASVNADAVLDLEDPQGHHLVGKGREPFATTALMSTETVSGEVRYVLSVDTKDGRYRARLGSFEHRARGSSAGFATHFGLLTGVADPGKEQCSSPLACTPDEWRVRVWSDLRGTAETVSRRLLGSLQRTRAVAGSADDDW
jgi:hypothetical protein